MQSQSELKISMCATADLRPAPYNPRDISSVSFEGLKESIKKFGFVDPLIVNRRTGFLVGGHQRLKAAEALGIAKVPVVEVDLGPAEEKALNVILNSSRIAGFFTEALQDILNEIKVEMPDLMGPLMFDGLVLKEWDQAGADPDKLTDYDKDADTFAIRIAKVSVEDKQEVLDAMSEALKGSGYNAVAE